MVLSSLLNLILFSVCGVVMSRTFVPEPEFTRLPAICRPVDTNESSVVCGIFARTMTYHCCGGDVKRVSDLCYNMTKTEDVLVDVPLRCENGGTKIQCSRQVASGDQLDDGESETMDEPVSEKCACPPNFTGRCCEKRKEIPTCPSNSRDVPLMVPNPFSNGCTDDQDCQGNKTCCISYHGFPVCMDPKPEDPCKGVDCGPKRACKPSEIGHHFVSPYIRSVAFECAPLERPGMCPPFYDDIAGRCIGYPNPCRDDSRCSVGEKCCRSFCTDECTKSLPEVADPCAAGICGKGYDCDVEKGEVICKIRWFDS
ncbi:neurogenic locus notch homolog protein 2-like isoform X2 [Corticium candelabrum]|uniref:neurogenic locus notch homolog protein 2-like isoform X2 n=1 Tax=Corticium candelabrum TaxID=121492 RepID=UPI002E257B80|nr:neurogenic locus notch homolog protein 2-like isoform X2 [Corticium candelabrum]